MRQQARKRWAIMAVFLAGLGACTGANRDASVFTVADPAPIIISASTTPAKIQPPVPQVKSESSAAAPDVLTAGLHGEDLPGKIQVPSSTLHDVPVTAALQAVLAGTNIPLSWKGAVTDHTVTIEGLAGPLPDVVDKICAVARISCSYQQGMLELAVEQTVRTKLKSPPVPAPPLAAAPVPPVKTAAPQRPSLPAAEADWPEPVVIDKDGAAPFASALSQLPMRASAGTLTAPQAPSSPLPKSTIDPSIPAAVIYNRTNAAVLGIPFGNVEDPDGDGL